MVTEHDPTTLSLSELRAKRTELQYQDDVVSYARRVAQARLDLVQAEIQRRRTGGDNPDLTEELRAILSENLTTGTARPPRPIDEPGRELTDDPIVVELESLCNEKGFDRLDSLDADEIDSLARSLIDFEQRMSVDRRERFDRLDALSAELVRRYREGEASVDGLLDRS